MDKITTTIRREPLREIVAGGKKVEYREIKPCWIKRLSAVRTPFLLRLINGMQARAPEVTTEFHSIVQRGLTGAAADSRVSVNLVVAPAAER